MLFIYSPLFNSHSCLPRTSAECKVQKERVKWRAFFVRYGGIKQAQNNTNERRGILKRHYVGIGILYDLAHPTVSEHNRTIKCNVDADDKQNSSCHNNVMFEN